MRLFVLLAALAFTATHAFAEPRISRGRVAEESGVRLAPLVDGLAYPWSMTWLPDGTLVVTEREGRLRLIRDGVLSPVSDMLKEREHQGLKVRNWQKSFLYVFSRKESM